MGLFDFFKSEDNKKPSIDLTDFKFLSDDHTRIENGRPTTANNKGAWRGVRVKTSDNQTFFVTMYNMNENHPVWGDSIQMAEKRMKVIEENNDKTILRGFGADVLGASFADYGLTLHKSNNIVNKVTLHIHDRSIDIVYQKAENKAQSTKLDKYSKSDSFENFVERFRTRSMQEKMQIAMQTDLFNNQGADAYENGNTELAIEKLGGQDVLFKPKLKGYSFIPDLYADISIGDSLFEIKTVNRNFKSSDLKQLFIYIALRQVSGEENWKFAGLYNPRKGVYCKFNIKSLIYNLTGGKTPNEAFENLLNGLNRDVEIDSRF